MGMMAAGVIGLILTIVMLAPRRRRTVGRTRSTGTAAPLDTARPMPRTVVVDEHVIEDPR